MFNVNNIVAVAALMLPSITPISAYASLFDDNVDPTESAQAVIKCAEEAKDLFSAGRSEYLATVTGKHEKISATVDIKRYTFQAASGGAFGGPPASEGNTLYVDVKVTQSPNGSMAPSSLEWSCALQIVIQSDGDNDS